MIRLYDEIPTGPYAYLTYAHKFRMFYEEESSTKCWEYKGRKFSNGYGKFGIGAKDYLAHRISYYMYNKSIDKTKVVMHSCDNRLCVNPNHLILGSQIENMQDMVRKGRQGKARGDANGRSKLSGEDIKLMFLLKDKGLSIKEIAEYFPVLQNHIGRILSGKRRCY